MTENDTKTHDRQFLPTGQNRTPKIHRQTDMPLLMYVNMCVLLLSPWCPIYFDRQEGGERGGGTKTPKN